MEPVHMPVTDGQPPSPAQVRSLVRVVDRTSGIVFLHCGEGVGRAGTMSSAYKVTTGQSSASDALRESLAIGVLTLEQIAFIRSLDHDGAHEPPAVVTAVSRFLDGPRQLFNRFV
jgi:protein-tyrosine phosphatase